MNDRFVEAVVAKFLASVRGSYELEEPIVVEFGNMLRSVLNEVGVPSAAESTSAPAVVSKRAVRAKSEKKPRKKSGYNIFVSVKMQDEQINLLNNRERMGAIGRL